MADRDYRVSRTSRPAPRESYDEIEPISRQRSRPQYYHDDPSSYQRGSRDGLSRASTRSDYSTSVRAPEPSGATKTTYKVGRDRESDPYVKRGNVIVLDSRLDRDRELSDWEVIRPERSESGAYVIETSSTSDYASPAQRQDFDYDDRRRPPPGREVDFLPPPRARRDRSMSRGTLEAMREVRVTEEYPSDDDRRSLRSRRTVRPAETDAAAIGTTFTGHGSSLRHNHSPDSVTRRRSRSIGFVRDQISHHDASESKHERPGAEANVAGKYLIHHRGERMRRRDDDDDESAFSDYAARRSKPEGIDTYGAGTERTRRDERPGGATYRYEEDEYDRRRGAYPPYNDPRRYRRGEGDDDEDDERYSEYYDGRTSRRYR